MVEELDERLKELANYDINDYEIVTWFVTSFLSYVDPYYEKELIDDLKKSDVKDMKKVCYQLLTKLVYRGYKLFNMIDYPEQVLYENHKLFLIGDNISHELRIRYQEHKLEISDIKNNIDLFVDVPLQIFVSSVLLSRCISNIGSNNFLKLLRNYPDLYDMLFKKDYEALSNFAELFSKINTLDLDFQTKISETLKLFLAYKYIHNSSGILDFLSKLGTITIYLKMGPVQSTDGLYQLKNNTMTIDGAQYIAISRLGIDNIIHFEEEYHFFFKYCDKGFNILGMLGEHIYKENREFVNNKYTYEEFQHILAQYLNSMRYDQNFKNITELFDKLEGDFRSNHSFLFIDSKAPSELRQAFYSGPIFLESMHSHFEYIPYLKDKDIDLLFHHYSFVNFGDDYTEDYFKYYVEHFGLENLLMKICSYGTLMSDLSYGSYNKSDSLDQADKALRNNIYYYILSLKSDVNYEELLIEPNLERQKFIEEHSDIFLTKEELHIPEEKKDIFIEQFYRGRLLFSVIQEYPSLKKDLANKNLSYAFNFYWSNHIPAPFYGTVIGLKNEVFLELCDIYGETLKSFTDYYHINDPQKLSLDELCNLVDGEIIRKCKEGLIIGYNDIVPDFLKQKHPELFLDDDADSILQSMFYKGLTFDSLRQNKDWIPYLKDKYLDACFIMSYQDRDSIHEYFELFGNELGLKVGVRYPKIFSEMIYADKADVMKIWYDKTGQKFLPDYVVMQNIDIGEIDKFLSSATNWGKIMKNKRYSDRSETRDAILKLSYVMGVFDNDPSAFNQMQELLAGIPHNITDYEFNELKNIEHPNLPHDLYLADHLLNRIMPIQLTNLSQIYKEDQNGQYNLIFNQQQNIKLTQTIRKMLEYSSEPIVLTPDLAHQLFGRFELKYDPDFKQFLLTYWDDLISNKDGFQENIASIQRMFKDIKTINSNRILTLDLVLNYVKTNKYDDIQIGNEGVAVISSIAGYSQAEFDKLQEIYNYGKQRTFSSIPRIQGSNNKYHYELLRLDDPLALAIGTLTNCCQELGNAAEQCMQHSMVSEDGRVFVVRDQDGNIMAQSWVWRNGDVICFDNIEIPIKAFKREVNIRNKDDRQQFALDIFKVYQKAAQELMKEDKQKYQELLEQGIISQEQYDRYCVKKVTTGLGYNDIADVIKANTELDTNITRPKFFDPPVELNRKLYTSDSDTQYLLNEDDKDSEFKEGTLLVYSDDLPIYTDDNFDRQKLFILDKLKERTYNDYFEDFGVSDDKKIVSQIASKYGLIKDHARIVMHPNFAIIYENDHDKIVVGDLLYNNKVNIDHEEKDITDVLVKQISIVLKQISDNKQILSYMLSDNQQKIFALAQEKMRKRKIR